MLTNVIAGPGGAVTLTINGIGGRSYAIYGGTNLLDLSGWTLVTNLISPTSFALPAIPGLKQRFYRAKEL